MTCDSIDDFPPASEDPDFNYLTMVQGLMHARTELRLSIVGELELVFGLSCGLSAIQHAVDYGLRSSAVDLRADLLEALALAHAKARIELPSFDRDELANGIDAAIGLVAHIFESEQRRNTTTANELELLRAHARILRNDLHNASLLLHSVTKAREARRTGQYSQERFERVVRAHFCRMAINEIMNAQLRGQVRGRPAPLRGLRLIA